MNIGTKRLYASTFRHIQANRKRFRAGPADRGTDAFVYQSLVYQPGDGSQTS
jgi:hypothetical protein